MKSTIKTYQLDLRSTLRWRGFKPRQQGAECHIKIKIKGELL